MEADAHNVDIAVVSGSVDDRHVTTITAVENLIFDRWNHNIAGCDEEKGLDEPSSPIDNDDKSGWEPLEGGLSAWDQLGEGYERHAAAVGESMITRN